MVLDTLYFTNALAAVDLELSPKTNNKVKERIQESNTTVAFRKIDAEEAPSPMSVSTFSLASRIASELQTLPLLHLGWPLLFSSDDTLAWGVGVCRGSPLAITGVFRLRRLLTPSSATLRSLQSCQLPLTGTNESCTRRRSLYTWKRQQSGP